MIDLATRYTVGVRGRRDGGRATSTTAKHRALLVTMSLLVVTGLTGCWYQAGWDGTHTNDNTSESTLGAANVATLAQKWLNSSLSYVADPSVANDLVYVADGSGPAIESLSETTGAVQTRAVESGSPTAPAVGNPASGGDGLVFTTESGNSASLQAFDANLKLVWSRTLPGKTPTSVTLVPNGPSSTGTGNAGMLLVTLLDTHRVVAYSDAGVLLGSSPTGGAYSTAVTVGNDLAYVGRTDAKLDALHLPSLTLDWTATVGTATSTGLVASPSVADGSVLAATGNGVVGAFDATTGKLQWRDSNLSGAVRDTMAVGNGRVYVTENQAAASPLYALDETTGAQLWHHQDAATGSKGSGPTLANGLVYFYTGAAGTVDALDAATGVLASAIATKNTATAFSPVVSDGDLFVTGSAGLQVLAPAVSPTRDPSTPAASPVPRNVPTTTSPAFSPPATTVLYAVFSMDSPATTPLTTVASVTNSGVARTWHLLGRENHSNGNTVAGFVEVWWAANPTAQSAISVTATFSRNTKDVTAPVGDLQVLVMDHAAPDQSAAAWTPNWLVTSKNNAATATVTTTAPDSVVFGVFDNWDNSETPVPGPDQSIISIVLNDADRDGYWVQTKNTPVVTPGPVQVNAAISGISDQWHAIAWEVLAAH